MSTLDACPLANRIIHLNILASDGTARFRMCNRAKSRRGCGQCSFTVGCSLQPATDRFDQVRPSICKDSQSMSADAGDRSVDKARHTTLANFGDPRSALTLAPRCAEAFRSDLVADTGVSCTPTTGETALWSNTRQSA